MLPFRRLPTMIARRRACGCVGMKGLVRSSSLQSAASWPSILPRDGQNHRRHFACTTKTPKAPSSSLGDNWHTITTQLLKDLQSTSASPVLPSTMHQLQEAIKYYTSVTGDLQRCWDLLNALADRCTHHQHNKGGAVTVIPYTILVPLVNLWRRQIKAAGRPNPRRGWMAPPEMARTLSRYQQAGIIQPSAPKSTKSTATERPLPSSSTTQYLSAMILDVATHLATSSSPSNRHSNRNSRRTRGPTDQDRFTAGSQFCQDFLQEWILDSSREPPDVVVVGTVLQAIVATSESPQRAEAFWKQITQQLRHLQPNEFWYNSMISAWAKRGNVPMAMKWLNRMRMEGRFEPDLATWNSLLSAHAKQHEDTTATASRSRSNVATAEQAESILYQMIELYEQGHIKEPPNVISFSTVLDAWAQRAWKNPRAAQRAQQLLERMEHGKDGDGGIPAPNIISYNTVIQAHARAGNPERAEQVFLGLLEKDHLRPNEISVTAVLSAWSQVGTWEAAERAERILKEVLPQMGLEPDLYAYGATLACWAKISGQKQAMERAQALFDELLVSSSPNLRPDVVAYTNLMNVYGRNDQPEKAESLLQDMLQFPSGQDNNHHNLQLKPNVHTFSVIISAWSRSSRDDGVKRAEQWLYRMQDEFGVSPNVVSYTTVLHAWSKRARKDPEAPDRAHKILRTISKMANSRSFAAVIQAYAQQGRAEEAEALLHHMLEDSCDSPQPDAFVFGAVLHAWSKTTNCPTIEAAKRAEKLLMLMHDLHSSKRLRDPPNVVCFSNVLQCWSRIPGVEGAERAHAILETMTSYGAQPNIFSINIVMNAWANHASKSPQAVDKAFSLFELARKSQQPDEYTYRALFKAITLSSLPDKFLLMLPLKEEMSRKGIRIDNSYAMSRLKDAEGDNKEDS